MLDTDVDSLGENLSAVTLVHDNSKCVLGDVVDASSLSVIGLEGHTFVDSSVTLKWSEFSLVGPHKGSRGSQLTLTST